MDQNNNTITEDQLKQQKMASLFDRFKGFGEFYMMGHHSIQSIGGIIQTSELQPTTEQLRVLEAMLNASKEKMQQTHDNTMLELDNLTNAVLKFYTE